MHHMHFYFAQNIIKHKTKCHAFIKKIIKKEKKKGFMYTCITPKIKYTCIHVGEKDMSNVQYGRESY